MYIIICYLFYVNFLVVLGSKYTSIKICHGKHKREVMNINKGRKSKKHAPQAQTHEQKTPPKRRIQNRIQEWNKKIVSYTAAAAKQDTKSVSDISAFLVIVQELHILELNVYIQFLAEGRLNIKSETRCSGRW